MYSRLTIPRTTPFFFLYCFRDDSFPLSFSLFNKALLLGFRVLPFFGGSFFAFVFFLGQFSPTKNDFGLLETTTLTTWQSPPATATPSSWTTRRCDFCWTLSAGFFFLLLLVFSSEKKIPKLYRENGIQFIPRLQKSNSMRWKRDDDLFSKTTHPPTALGGGDDFVATFFSLSLSSMMMIVK